MPESVRSNGHLTDVDGQRVLRFVRRFDAPRTDVWDAITSRDRMARWSFPGTIEPRPGGAVRFEFENPDGGEPLEGLGSVIRWDEAILLEYEWSDGAMSWQIRFALADAADGGTILTFDHLLPDAAQPEFAAGWHWHLDRLATHMAGDEPAAVDVDDHFEALLVQYRSQAGGET